MRIKRANRDDNHQTDSLIMRSFNFIFLDVRDCKCAVLLKDEELLNCKIDFDSDIYPVDGNIPPPLGEDIDR